MWATDNLSKSNKVNYNDSETVEFLDELFAKFNPFGYVEDNNKNKNEDNNEEEKPKKEKEIIDEEVNEEENTYEYEYYDEEDNIIDINNINFNKDEYIVIEIE